MEFKKYSSIENAYRTKYVQKCQTFFPKEEFIVQEKIHELFQHVKLCEFFDRESQEVTLISIHGEIYGGSYPHPDVDVDKSAKKVQKGVFYDPQNRFIGFDMKINGEYINIDKMNEYLDRCGIPRLEILERGSLEKCLEYPNDFNSHLHEDLPELEDNVCEGTVIKPVNPVRFNGGERPVIKNKNAKWSEKKKTVKVKEELPENIKEFVQIAETYVTENRLRNVLSKIGPVTDQKKAFGQILGAFTKDTVEDFMKENENFQELDKKDRKLVTSRINGFSANLIRPNFANILDGEF